MRLPAPTIRAVDDSSWASSLALIHHLPNRESLGHRVRSYLGYLEASASKKHIIGQHVSMLLRLLEITIANHLGYLEVSLAS